MQKQIRKPSWKRSCALSIMAAYLLSGGALQAFAADIGAVIPVGRAAGIRLTANGVMVVRLSGVQTAIGMVYPAKEAGLKEGDMLLSVEGKRIDSNESLQQAVSKATGATISVEIDRAGQTQTLQITPLTDTAGHKKIGVMVRDSMAGIGTITYVDPATGAYGSLGHGICDTETGILLPMASGTVTQAEVTDVKRGTSGDPGELHGAFQEKTMGTVTENTVNGIYGVLTDDAYYAKMEALPVAKPEEVKVGEAEIICNVEGEAVETYAVKITKVFDQSDELGRCMLLEVTDPALLEKTGGVVQGMSGSPVVQNGKIVGAVTHVLVNDPTRGYAIFIEKMLDEMTN